MPSRQTNILILHFKYEVRKGLFLSDERMEMCRKNLLLFWSESRPLSNTLTILIKMFSSKNRTGVG